MSPETTKAPAPAPPEHDRRVSPEYVRLSMAAAMELGLEPGKMLRDCGCGCINLLQSYAVGCYANCSYCGLARERPGAAEENTFIRVAWPMYRMERVAQKIAEKEASHGVGRVCVSQVQTPRSYEDLVRMTAEVHEAAPEVPISALVSATTLDEDRLARLQEVGADIIGVGLDAATKELFHRTRGRGAKGPHDWDHHWRIVRAARERFGPYRVNCHVMVGLGETDRELVDLFVQLNSEQIAAYLFSFNPEPGTAMEGRPRAPIQRLRRIQLVKEMLEKGRLERDEIEFDEAGDIAHIDADRTAVQGTIDGGTPFMTDGCPDRAGKVACNRPCGSYRPGEEFRDYPFQPEPDDLVEIRRQLALEEVWLREHE